MEHIIRMTTVDALVVCKALEMFDFQNETDKAMAGRISGQIKSKVAHNLKGTNLVGKCGSCKWAETGHNSLIECTYPSKKEKFFYRTQSACKKFYEKKQENCI